MALRYSPLILIAVTVGVAFHRAQFNNGSTVIGIHGTMLRFEPLAFPIPSVDLELGSAIKRTCISAIIPDSFGGVLADLFLADPFGLYDCLVVNPFASLLLSLEEEIGIVLLALGFAGRIAPILGWCNTGFQRRGRACAWDNAWACTRNGAWTCAGTQ